ncbi:hypothetical protein MCOR04_004541 [Pyricularia oryzae]|nr:hypothetical protein MCOR04_004541 [Pyricularia oryzae]
MCIVVLTTAHPDYALIVINNRDEYILRPTSRPHWWTPSPRPKDGAGQQQNRQSSPPPPPPPQILSSRDLNRPERGTWLGITRTGNFACLTNYSEADPNDARHSIHGVRSRGAIVSAWLAADPAERTPDFVHRILSGSGVKGVGGFSLVCGKLRRRRRFQTNQHPQHAARSAPAAIDPLAVISNRSEHPEHVPYIASQPSETHGLSNTVFDAPGPPWPKVSRGCDLLNRTVASAVPAALTQDQLVASLFSVLSTDDLPRLSDDAAAFETYQPLLRTSVFIPPLGRDESWLETRDFGPADRDAAIAAPQPTHPQPQQQQQQQQLPQRQQQPSPPLEPAETLAAGSTASTPRPDAKAPVFTTGMYGTQRQTVILVDWEGNVRYTERALWDDLGNPLAPGEGDVTFRFQIEGWDDEYENDDAELDGGNVGSNKHADC